MNTKTISKIKRTNKTADMKEYRKAYYLSHKEKSLESSKEWLNDKPWYNRYKRAESRCNHDKNSSYYGMEFTIRPSDVKEAWDLAQGWNLDEPSIDRKNDKIGYVPGNIRIIELQENLHKKRTRRQAVFA